MTIVASAMRLQHVSIPIPDGAQHAGRAFYAGVLGLEEKPVPGTRSGAGLVWFAAGPGELEVHLVPDPAGLVPEAKRHFCLAVDELDATREELETAGVETWDAPPIPGRPRFYCRDPFGNQIEIVRMLDGGVAEVR
jgi:catechol 2,3-dioxygenase-like lactoylglutathione lyase family enzyme